MTPMDPCYRLAMLVHLTAQARSLGESHHVCWNGEKPILHDSPQLTLESHFMGVAGFVLLLKE